MPWALNQDGGHSPTCSLLPGRRSRPGAHLPKKGRTRNRGAVPCQGGGQGPPGTVVSETSPKTAVPFPSDTAPGMGRLVLAAGQCPEISCFCWKPEPITLRPGRGGRDVSQPHGCITLAPSSSGARLREECAVCCKPPRPGSFCSCQI